MLTKFAVLFCLATIIGQGTGQEEYTLNNGHKIPNFGLGTSWATNVQTVVKVAIENGYRLIDTASVYRNEFDIGKGLEAVFQAGTVKREDLFIISKLASDMHRVNHVLPAIKKSLQDLQLEYLDLYLVHWPFAIKPKPDENEEDTNVTLEDTWRAMEELVKLNYTKSIGLSNFNSQQIERILKIATIKPVVNQVECNPYMSQEKLREFCKQREILLIAYSPLYREGFNNSHGLNLFKEPTIEELALKYKKSPAQIILRYLVQSEVIPIPKSSSVEHLRSNINIFDFVIAQEDVEKMRVLNKNKRLIEADK